MVLNQAKCDLCRALWSKQAKPANSGGTERLQDAATRFQCPRTLERHVLRLVVLLFDFLDDFLLDALLLAHSGLHLRALLESSLCVTEQLLKLIYLKLTGLTECHTAATPTMQIEIAVIAERLVMDLAIGCQAVFVLAHRYL